MGLSDKYMVSWFVHPSVGGNFTPHPPYVPKNPLVSRQSHCPNYHYSIPAPPNQLGLNKMYLFVFSRKCIYNFSDHAGMKFREYRENPKFTKFSRQYFRTIPTLPSVYFSQYAGTHWYWLRFRFSLLCKEIKTKQNPQKKNSKFFTVYCTYCSK